MEQHHQQLVLKHTSLTCVHYQRGDTAGKALAHIALAPVLLLVFQFAKVYTRREVHEAVLLAGLVIEEALARALKHLLQHPRPATCALLHMCHSHGMPSSHTSMMFCWTALALCSAYRQSRSQQSGKQGGGPAAIARLLTALELLAYISLSVGVAVSRVYLGYHSIDQVAAGAALGVVFGVAWALVMHVLQPLYRAVAGVKPLQDLGVKDTYSCADPLLVEAAAHAGAAGNSQGGSSKKQS